MQTQFSSHLVELSRRAMRYVTALRYPSKAARILSSHMSTHLKVLWFKTHFKAMLYGLRRLAVRNTVSWHELHSKELWYRGIVDEVKWWQQWLGTEEGQKWKDEIQNPERVLQDYLVTDRIHTIPSDSISILDVGAGPVTSLGYTYPGKAVDITAVDPLANEYERILRDANIIPPVRTIRCHGEQLLGKFEPESFDFAYASNALDHSYDPLLIIRNMLAVVRKKRFVLFRHYMNEGKTGNYGGFHQWNFDIKKDDFILWNEACQHNITHILCREAQVECYYESSTVHGAFDYSDWVVCTITKL